ncbi:unnamed protein product [Peniophora sp. CBMAI 1063]|nr:unnamed protein product [Peniophora sp. CBMAI 1063]
MAESLPSLSLQTPQTFPKFPYDVPYDIQVSLMAHVYESIEQRKVAIVESPTGTGKTSSLLCATLTWLDDDRDRARKGQLEAASGAGSGEPDWVLEQTRERLRRELERADAEYAEKLVAARKREEIQRRKATARVRKKQIEVEHDSDSDEDSFLPEDDAKSSKNAAAYWLEVLNPATRDENEATACTKIFYASRTHSQLTQVIPELRKLRRFVNLLPSSSDETRNSVNSIGKKRTHDALTSPELPSSVDRESRIVTLGSRKQLCINDELKAKGGDLDENCRDLLQAGEKRCQYMPPIGENGPLSDLRDQILASPKDIEDLVQAGQSAHTCPYFASRAAIPQAELVTLPYNLLLQANAREALNIDLAGNVVVVDEAHNLTAALLQLSSVSVPLRTLELCIEQLGNYLKKFRNRLASRHRLHLDRLHKLMEGIRKIMLKWKQLELPEVATVQDVISRFDRNLDGVNVLEIETYLKSSKIARKISSYADKQADRDADTAAKGKPGRGPRKPQSRGQPALYVVQGLITALAEANDDGRFVLVATGQGDSQSLEIKYNSLNPAPHFKHVVDTARSVILAGGTMSPMSDLVNNLFRHVPRERISTFSCGHIIPAANLQTLALSKSPRGGDLTFKFATMSDPAVITDLGQVLLNMARVVPGGMVVFVPSYNFLNQVMKTWKEKKLLESLNSKKKVFVEPNTTTEVPTVLHSYATEVHNNASGALLFAVVGAKLSEGLNFSDDLARMVVIVGLPFANLGSPELQERLKYADRLAGHKPPAGSSYGTAGKELYENLCMNAVNQSIGRAIRHKNDWAALVLIDARYQTQRISDKLPKWIGRTLVAPQNFGQAMKIAGQFYSSKKAAKIL